MITTMRQAYRSGFASSLIEGTISAYLEAAKFPFDPSRYETLMEDFLQGYRDGLRLQKNVDVRYFRKLTPIIVMDKMEIVCNNCNGAGGFGGRAPLIRIGYRTCFVCAGIGKIKMVNNLKPLVVG